MRALLPKGYVWIPWYEDIYAINEQGEVCSFWKKIRGWCILSLTVQRIMTPRKNQAKKWSNCKERVQVTLYNWDTKKKYYVNRLMAEIFMDGLEKWKQVIHLNWDPSDNSLSNLKQASVSERAKRFYSRKKKSTWWY